MKTVKIKFVGFWAGFREKQNFVYHILSERYHVEISENRILYLFIPWGTPLSMQNMIV